MRHAIYMPNQRTAVVYESETEHGQRREILRRQIPVKVWETVVRCVKASSGTDAQRAERLAEVTANLAEPDAMGIYRDTAGKSAFNVPGYSFVRRIANGSAVSYVCRDGSRFVVSDARGYHAAIDRDGNEWAMRPSSTVARGTAQRPYGTTNHGQD